MAGLLVMGLMHHWSRPPLDLASAVAAAEFGRVKGVCHVGDWVMVSLCVVCVCACVRVCVCMSTPHKSHGPLQSKQQYYQFYHKLEMHAICR